MALTDKNIIITPNTGQTSDPTIVFSGADTSTSAQNISLKVYPISSGTLSFEGSSGQLFSISNKLSGTIFSVNDISGIPSIEVLDTGIIKLGQYGGNILLGTGSDDSNKLQVAGGISVSGNITVGGTVYANVIGTITTATSAATAYALANTSTTYVGRAVLADTATTATSAATAYAFAGLLPIAQGGTNSSATPTAGGVGYGTGSAHSYTSAGTNGQIFVSSGTSVPVFQLFDMSIHAPDSSYKKLVRAATVGANITVASAAPNTLDGVTLALNDRILVKDQSTPAQNGIYYVSTLGTGANGVWTRSTDADVAGDIDGATVAVGEGTINGGKRFQTPFKTTDTVGTTAMYWNKLVDVFAGSSASVQTTAIGLDIATPTDPVTFATGAVTDLALNSFGSRTVSAVAASAYTRASTVYIAGAPVASTNATITTPYALYVAGGNTYLAGSLTVVGTLTGTASTATSAATAYSLANTSTTYVGRSVLADSATTAAFATTATSAATAYSWVGGVVGNTSTFNAPVTFSFPVTFNGTSTYVLSTNTIYTDNLIELHTPPGGVGSFWNSDDGKDIGLRFHYYTNSTDTNAALVLANDTKMLEFYNSGAESITGTFAGASYGGFKLGNIQLVSTTANSNNATSGALTVAGGVGVGGSIFVSGVVTATTFIGALTGTASTATSAATAYALANTSTTYVGRSVLADTATTATSAATAYALANTSTTYVGRSVLADTATTATSAATAYALSYTIQPAGGGTGVTTYAAYDLLYGTTSGPLGKLTMGTAGQVLQVNTSGSALIYGDIDGGTY